MKILIGTSGYSFLDWVGPFYPAGTERREMLDHYVRQFPCVEVNSTYYRIPPASTLRGMERKTPPGFEFVVKTHRDMTHERSADPDLYRSLAHAVEPIRAAGKLSGLLAQFPQSFHRTAENEEYLEALKRRLPDTPLFIEFRHNSWAGDDVLPRLKEMGVGYVSVDEPDLPGLMPSVARVTGDVAYVRLHGRNKRNWYLGDARAGTGERAALRTPAHTPASTGAADPRSKSSAPPAASLGPLFSGEAGTGAPDRQPSTRDRALLRYDYLYSEAELKEWVDKIRDLAAKSKKTFVFFNNCHAGQAATGAKLMRRLLEGEGLL